MSQARTPRRICHHSIVGSSAAILCPDHSIDDQPDDATEDGPTKADAKRTNQPRTWASTGKRGIRATACPHRKRDQPKQSQPFGPFPFHPWHDGEDPGTGKAGVLGKRSGFDSLPIRNRSFPLRLHPAHSLRCR